MSPSVAILSTWFNTRQLGLASAVASSGTGLALVVAGPVVPQIIDAAGANGWRVSWYFFAGVALLMAVLTGALERDRPREEHKANREPPRAQAAAAEGLPRRTIWTDLKMVLGSGYAWHLGITYLIYGFAYLLYYTFFQKRLTADLGLSSQAAGDLFLLAGACSIVFGVLWGAASDRFGRGKTLAAIFLADGIAACLFAFKPGLAGLIISSVLFGSGVFSVPGLMGAACGDRFGAKFAFASFGFVTVFIGIGQATGPLVGGVLEDSFGTLGPSYLVSTGLFAVAAVSAFLVPDARRNCPEPVSSDSVD